MFTYLILYVIVNQVKTQTYVSGMYYVPALKLICQYLPCVNSTLSVVADPGKNDFLSLKMLSALQNTFHK